MSKVLLVEDDLVTCDMVRDWLEHELYTVEEAHTGEEALDLMKLYQYDIVVLDWGLPGKSGVGGGIAALLPGQYSIAVWSPELNQKGNSVLGTKALELFTTMTGRSVF